MVDTAIGIILGGLPFLLLALLPLSSNNLYRIIILFLLTGVLTLNLEFVRTTLDYGVNVTIGYNETVYTSLNKTTVTNVYETQYPYAGFVDVVFTFEKILFTVFEIGLVLLSFYVLYLGYNILKKVRI